jgi:tetratricopeptide (TPR) repeat protein
MSLDILLDNQHSQIIGSTGIPASMTRRVKPSLPNSNQGVENDLSRCTMKSGHRCTGMFGSCKAAGGRMDSRQAEEKGTLWGSISVLTRGGPFTVLGRRYTNPVLLRGMSLPTEAEYVFKNPVDFEHNYVNKPVTAELFFGENGNDDEDISLGVFTLFDREPAYPYLTGPEIFEITLAVSTTQMLSISALDWATRKYYCIGYMDISGLEAPQPEPGPDKPVNDFTKEGLQAMADDLLKTPPRQARHPRRGSDLSEALTISFEEAFHGAKKDIQAASTQPCPVCAGSGVSPGKSMVHCRTCEGVGFIKEEHQIDGGPEYKFSTCPDCKGDGLINAFPCQKCKGNGWVRSTRPMILQIPAFIDSGAEICLFHQGGPGLDGGPAGHLRITIHVTAHPLFSRSGRELSIVLPVSAGFARQGGRLRVPGIEPGDSYFMELPAGTQDQSLFRVMDADGYSLIACIETYRPGLLFAFPQVKARLREIHDRLGGAELEVPAGHPGGSGLSQQGGAAFTGQAPSQVAHFYVQRGKLYAAKNDGFHAMSDFNKALKLDPACAEAYDRRAVLHGLNKDFDKALVDMEKALELEPRNAEYLCHKGMIHHHQYDPDKALALYDRALEIDPTCLEAYECRGLLAAARGDPQAAVADFSRVLEADPDNVDIRNKRSQAYAALKEFDQAIADLDYFLERHPTNSRGFNNRGFVRLQKNDLGKALDDYDRALELDPKLVPARIYRGKTHFLLGQFEKAIEDLNQALTLNPQEPYPHFLLGQAYQGMGEKKQAGVAYRRYLDSSHSPELCQEARQHLSEMGIKAS